MKATVVILLLTLVIAPIGAAVPTANDVTVAVAAITDATISAVAAFLNTPPLKLPGIETYQEAGKTLPHLLRFTDSDTASYAPVFRQTQPAQRNFFSSLLSAARGPLNEPTLQLLTLHAWQEGHARLTGTASTEWGVGVTLTNLMAKVISGIPIDPITVKADVKVSGRRVSTDVHIVGVFVIESTAEGFVEIRPLSMEINGDAVATPGEER
ncbi:MAG: hypothetical protein RBS49_01830 [Sphaerochaeta sp.]|jgi:hypothetical protein|nr:hypothetical protein [Sphaerochaeta sp.]MDX9914602.1 hypothetical protein [Sphaerochaeta sp.]